MSGVAPLLDERGLDVDAFVDGGGVHGRTQWQLFWERFREDRVALVALGFIGAEVLIAVFAPVIVGAVAHPPDAQYPSALDPTFGTPSGPSRTFFFGVDPLGEDVFSRVLYGARVSLEVAIVATALSVVIGVALGMVAGYYRGFADTAVSRFVDIMLAFPVLLLALGIASACSLGGGCAGGLVKPGLAAHHCGGRRGGRRRSDRGESRERPRQRHEPRSAFGRQPGARRRQGGRGAPEGIPQHGTALARADAPVTLVEYADLQCPYCAMWERNVLPALVREDVRAGKLRIEFCGLAFIGADSEIALRTALAAASANRLWNVVELLYLNQGAENSGWVTPLLLHRILRAAGVEPAFRDALNSPAIDRLQAEATAQAVAAHVNGTPAFELGRTRETLHALQTSSLSPPPFRAAVEQALDS